MKPMLFIFMMLITSQVFATLEHQKGFDSKPSAERLSKARGCFNEIEDLGCQHPREGQEKFNTCLSENFTELKPLCQSFFEKLYGKRASKRI